MRHSRARWLGPTGTATGHACGHNLIGAGAWGAAVAVRDWMAKTKTPGTVRLYGCPAEEGGSGKMWMAREGVFGDLDAALHWHPIERSAVANVRTTANTRLTIVFEGRSAHAGVSPWLGRSALHAVELFAHGVNAMREHLLPTARTHYVIDKGGLAPNVVTDKASVRIMMRDATSEAVLKTAEWVRDIAKGAALATLTKVKLTQMPGSHNVEPNAPLAQRAQQILEAVGAPVFTRDEHEFAKKLQKAFGVPEKGLLQRDRRAAPARDRARRIERRRRCQRERAHDGLHVPGDSHRPVAAHLGRDRVHRHGHRSQGSAAGREGACRPRGRSAHRCAVAQGGEGRLHEAPRRP